MAAWVLESRHWPFTRVSGRYTTGATGTPAEKEVLSGHLGEWFTVSCGAYCALRQYSAPEAEAQRRALLEAIRDEVNRHSEIFGSLWRAEEGLLCLQTSANLAHNFGDLDRVMDMWNLSIDDPLRLECYKLTATPLDPNGKLRHLGRLWVAGELYKAIIDGSSMAFENHRHFALRKPKCLRAQQEFLISNGPFFDQWGKTVALRLKSETGAPSEQTHEVVEALKHGWQRLPKTIGYGRALRGMLEVHPNLALDGPERAHASRAVLDTDQRRFEDKWAAKAIELLDDIPSRA